MQAFCPKCGQNKFKIADKSALGASLLLIVIGLISMTLIIAAVIIGDVFIIGGVVGLALFIWGLNWFVRKKFVYECRNCGQKIRVNPFRLS
jgi:hypothetical protein